MSRTRPMAVLATAVALSLAAVAAAGCGSNAGTSTAPPGRGHAATVSVGDTGLGKILVDSHGRTLYLFQKDSGSNSACSGECATAWPPLRASDKPTVGGGAQASLVGTTPRSDGRPQVTYDGHPLYGFKGDSRPGDTSGQGSTGFGAHWYVLSPSGRAITAAASGSGGGNGY